MTTGQRIKAARKAAGITQKELGEKIGVSFQGVAQWENDLRKPKYETLQRIADALNVEVQTLDERFSMRIMLEDFLNDGSQLPTPHAPDYWMVNSDGELIRASMQTTVGQLLYSFANLNEMGQQEAIRRIDELNEVPKYQRKEPHERRHIVSETITGDE